MMSPSRPRPAVLSVLLRRVFLVSSCIVWCLLLDTRRDDSSSIHHNVITRVDARNTADTHTTAADAHKRTNNAQQPPSISPTPITSVVFDEYRSRQLDAELSSLYDAELSSLSKSHHVTLVTPSDDTSSHSFTFSSAHHSMVGSNTTQDDHTMRVPLHLQSSILNDTCTLTSALNGSSLILSCPGCTVFIPAHQSFDVELFFSKAVNWAYVCSTIAIIQMYFTFKQIKQADAPAAAGRLCSYSIGMQGLLDGYQCM